jgi:hypothetical protein
MPGETKSLAMREHKEKAALYQIPDTGNVGFPACMSSRTLSTYRTSHKWSMPQPGDHESDWRIERR